MGSLVQVYFDLHRSASSVHQKIMEEEVLRDDDDVKELISNLQAIRTVFNDAEKLHVSDDALKEWSKKLWDTSYDFDDAFDECNKAFTKMLTKKAENASSSIRKVCSFIPSCLFSSKVMAMRHDIAWKLKTLSQTLDVIAAERDGFYIRLPSGTRHIELGRSMTSVIDSSEVLGRDEEKDRVLNLLLSESSQAPTLPIISVVGMEGIGKTALARELFNDNGVRAHFDKRIWVSASYPFNEISISKAILESLKGYGTSNVVDIDTVLQQISQFVEGKRLLIVLDDVWSEHSKYWKQLMYSLKSGSEGSRVLVTTCLENVANKLGTNKMISLGRLSDESSLSLFRRIALSERETDGCQELVEIGVKIVGKCKGLPLSVKILGSLLRFKRKFDEWQNVLDSKIWELKQVERNQFLPLLVSYFDLSPALRKCFLYCAMFPKNYEIEKDRLIKLWMAQGYLTVGGREDMELIGEEYFEYLAVRCFFQDFQRTKYDDKIVRCKMHDAVHDFAQFLTNNKCFSLEVNGSKVGQLEFSNEKIQHLLIRFEREGKFPKPVYNRKTLRSLVVDSGGGFMTSIGLSKLFDKLTGLRTLDLSDQDNVCYQVIKRVPRGIKKLIHLRYLNLSENSKIKKLPETLCELYNLETIELSWCINLIKLPQGMGKLIHLRHIVNDGTSLSYLPQGIERLTCLRTLSEFIVGGGSDDSRACKLECLKNFSHLRGSISIKKLGNVTKDEIKKAELVKMENLLDLHLSFEKDEEKGRMKKDDEDVLEDLQLPPNLERLEIFYYRGNRISLMRIMSLTELRMMTLDCYKNLEQLPRLGELPSLKSLTIRSMRSLEKVGNEFLGIDQSSSTGTSLVAFPKLQSLEFQKMKRWKEWSVTRRAGADVKIMPCLRSLTIGFCPKLETLPDDYLPQKLEDLKILSCPILEQRYRKGTAESNWSLNLQHVQIGS